MDLGLTRKETAEQLGTNAWSMKHWEERAKISIRPMFWPAIIAFLGYRPWLTPTSRGESLHQERLARGWSLQRLAQESGIDSATIRRLEQDRPQLAPRSLRAVLAILYHDDHS
jgi:hypothetical protein